MCVKRSASVQIHQIFMSPNVQPFPNLRDAWVLCFLSLSFVASTTFSSPPLNQDHSFFSSSFGPRVTKDCVRIESCSPSFPSKTNIRSQWNTWFPFHDVIGTANCRFICS